MSQGFLTLKRDIEDFVGRLDKYITEKGIEFAQRIIDLTAAVKRLEGEIKE